MNRSELEYLHSQIRLLEQQLTDVKAPGSITARAHAALLSVEWLLKQLT